MPVVQLKMGKVKTASLLVLSALGLVAAKEDVLYTKRHTKRGLESNGNYNICEVTIAKI